MIQERIAPEGAIWVCAACGKTHKDRYGMEGEGSKGWDESCMLNAVLCHDTRHMTKGGMLSWLSFDEPLPKAAP